MRAEGYSAGSQDLIFPSRLFPSARTLQADLRAAGIEPNGEGDRVVDFHSFRKTFTTALTEAGVHPRVVQALARHSRIDLTMGVYTDLERLDLRGSGGEPAGSAYIRRGAWRFSCVRHLVRGQPQRRTTAHKYTTAGGTHLAQATPPRRPSASGFLAIWWAL